MLKNSLPQQKLFFIIVLLFILNFFGNSCSANLQSQASTKTLNSNNVNQKSKTIDGDGVESLAEKNCVKSGWTKEVFKIDGQERKVLWKAPNGTWINGTILVFHGGGGKAEDFCTGGRLIQPQTEFTTLALENGFSVFALDATDDAVTDSAGRPCGKRFDFSVLNRKNIDLPYIEHILTSLIPSKRPVASNHKIFMAGLSSGGYMTIRAATHFDGLVTAFAPISSGDPYSTDTICDPSLSKRDVAKGILVDSETQIEITKDNACNSESNHNSSLWETQNPAHKPNFKIFAHKKDAIVDYSCVRKAYFNLESKGYPPTKPLVLNALSPKRRVIHHFWLNDYNSTLIDFFKNQ